MASSITFYRDTAWITAVACGLPAWGALFAFDLLPPTGDALLLLRFVLLQPVLEELVFRGLLQGGLREKMHWRWRGITAANVLTSIAFVAAHLVYQPPLWALAVFVPSLLFGYFRDRYDSVLPAVSLHVWYNAGFFLLPFFPL